jgi:hypothetical protein
MAAAREFSGGEDNASDDSAAVVADTVDDEDDEDDDDEGDEVPSALAFCASVANPHAVFDTPCGVKSDKHPTAAPSKSPMSSAPSLPRLRCAMAHMVLLISCALKPLIRGKAAVSRACSSPASRVSSVASAHSEFDTCQVRGESWEVRCEV